jgi:hypothetical protein
VRIGGHSKTATKLEIMVLQQVLRAVQGDKHAISFVIKHLQECVDVEQSDGLISILDIEGRITQQFEGGRFGQITYPDGRVEEGG